jgi:ectoine hydroxylase-related dioxygenase (phytanoyl-CoA dioxygenase family)
MPASYESTVRPIAEEEVATFNEQGWVYLPSLIDPAAVAELLEAAKAEMSIETDQPGDYGLDQLGRVKLSETVSQRPSSFDRRFLLRDGIEPFRSFLFSRDFGVSAQQLTDNRAPVRYHVDILWCKQRQGSPGNGPTLWHQDMAILPFDRPSPPQWWIALDEIEPAQGSLQFLTGSHREGLVRTRDPYKVYGGESPGDANLAVSRPDLFEKYETSKPNHLHPGDATIHHGYMVHSSGANMTDRVRWTYVVVMIADGTRYTAQPKHPNFDLGFNVGDVIEHHNFPLLGATEAVALR